MHEQQETHSKGFLQEQSEGNDLLWLRYDGILLERVEGSVPFEKNVQVHEKECPSRAFVHGDSLKDYFDQNTLSLPIFFRIIKSAMEGLQLLHQHGMLHGKVTPNNIIVSAYDGRAIWIDHINEGTESEDWESFWTLFLSQRDVHDVGVEFFCTQLNEQEDRHHFIETWSMSDSLSLWDKKCLQNLLCAELEISHSEEVIPKEKSNTIHEVSQEQRESWEKWISEGEQGESLASLFLEAYPSLGNDTLLHSVCEGILLGRVSPSIVNQYEEMFGGGEEDNVELELAEKSVSSAQAVWDLEQEIERLESLSWYDRNFGEAKEALSKAREDFVSALKEREECLPKLIPKARGLLDNEAALKIAHKKREKILLHKQETHDWKSWFPSKIYTPQSPYPLGVETRSIDIQGEQVLFRRMPQGFWKTTPMNHSMWVSQTLITQRLFTAVTGNQTSWIEGDGIPAHMMTYADALYFCNRLSEIFSLPPSYLFTGGAWSCISNKGFRLLGYEEFCYAMTANGIPTDDGDILRQAWCSENSKGKIHPVRTKESNDWGLYDIIGGLEEWVWTEEQHLSARVGGSWYHDRWTARNLDIKTGTVDLKADTIGFRVVLSDMIKEGVKGVSLG